MPEEMKHGVLQTATSWTSSNVAHVGVSTLEHEFLPMPRNQPQHTTVTLAGNTVGKDGHASLKRGYFNFLSRIIATALAMPWQDQPLQELTWPQMTHTF